MPKDTIDTAPPVDLQPPAADTSRLDNAFVPGQTYEPGPAPSIATVIKLWAGGEHRNALTLFLSLKPSAEDTAAVRAACPGWDELAAQ